MSDIETVIEDMIDARISNAVDTAVDNALDNKLDDAVDSKLDDIKSELESKYDDVEGKCDDVESKCDDIESRVDDLEGKDSLDINAVMTRLDGLELKLASLDPRIEEAMISANRNHNSKNELVVLLTQVMNIVRDIT